MDTERKAMVPCIQRCPGYRLRSERLQTSTSEQSPELRGLIQSLIFPRTVAVVGASDKSPVSLERVRNVLKGGARAWGVHPSVQRVLDLECSPTIGELPEVPELAVLLVGHRHAEEAFEKALASGVRAFVLPGLGNEVGAQAGSVRRRIAARAAQADAAIVGSNCMGIAVPDRCSPWLATLPDSFVPGHVATVVQSGSVGIALTALGPRIGFRCVVTTGDELVRDMADFCGYLATDGPTRAVGLFVEAIRRPRAFEESLRRLAECEKPVVCLKVGRSDAGARAAFAHTGALVGSDEAFRALLRRYEVITVGDFAELVETLEVLGRRKRPRGTRIGAITNSGGTAALLADHAEEAGIPIQPLPSHVAAGLSRTSPKFVSPGNPLDAWGIDEPERVYPAALRVMVESQAFDVLIAQVDQSQFLCEVERANVYHIAQALAEAVGGTDLFGAVTSTQTSDPAREVFELCRERDVALLRGTRNAIRALAQVCRWRPASLYAPQQHSAVDLSDLALGVGPIPELESSLVLERYGIEFPARERAASPEEAVEVARRLRPPLAVKLDGPAHKTRMGGVILGVETPEAAGRAATRIGPPVLIAEQVPAGVEAFCGFTRDPMFGPVLAVGLGGSRVEALAPPAVWLAPIDLDDAVRLVRESHLESLAPDAALEALARVLVGLGRLAIDHPEITEADANPVMLTRSDAVAVDALLVVDKGDSHG